MVFFNETLRGYPQPNPKFWEKGDAKFLSKSCQSGGIRSSFGGGSISGPTPTAPGKIRWMRELSPDAGRRPSPSRVARQRCCSRTGTLRPRPALRRATLATAALGPEEAVAHQRNPLGARQHSSRDIICALPLALHDNRAIGSRHSPRGRRLYGHSSRIITLDGGHLLFSPSPVSAV